ncbi:MAG: immunity protein Imm33 domain-containing protein [Candidatus Xenobia bacterium]
MAQFLAAPRIRHSFAHPCGPVLAEASALLEGQLVQFMEVLRSVEVLSDGFQIQFGWSFVRAQRRGESFHLVEPDLAGDPYLGDREDLTLTLLIAAWQALVCRRVGAVGPDTNWSHQIVLARHALERPRVFLKRGDTVSDDDSGWYVGGLEDAIAHPELETLQGWHLWQRRPALVTALCLPADTLVVFEEDSIVSVVDQDDRELWDQA